MGVVAPSLEPAAGSGSRRRYEPGDLLWLMVTCTLRAQGVGLEACRNVIAYLRAQGTGLNCPTDTRLVWADGKPKYFGERAAEAAEVNLKTPAALHLHIGALAAKTRRMLADLVPAQVHRLTIDDRTYRVVVTGDAEGAVARCSAEAGCVVRGPTVEDVLVMLADRLRTRHEKTRIASASRSSEEKPPVRSPRPDATGAATWGESW